MIFGLQEGTYRGPLDTQLEVNGKPIKLFIAWLRPRIIDPELAQFATPDGCLWDVQSCTDTQQNQHIYAILRYSD